jgi:hypothetical protein
MGEIKPLGSEKLQGTDKLNRILELTYFNKSKKDIKKDFELIKETTNGVFVISKEKDGYYVKRGLNENTVDYIGGLYMKNKNKFNSYAEALKRLNLLKGQEELNEATKYVLKQNKPTEDTFEETPLEPETPLESEPTTDEQPTTGAEATSGESEMKTSDYMSEVQKNAGKLGQSLRDVKEQMNSDDIKYVINMVLSAINLENLDPKDKEDISVRFETNNEETSSDENEYSGEDVPDGEELPDEETGDAELEETMNKLKKFINARITTDKTNKTREIDEISLSDYVNEEDDEYEEDIQEIDLEKIKEEINNSVHYTLGKYFK